MALNLNKPADNTLGDASEIRANQDAFAQSMYGVNFIPNGDFLIWPSSAMPAHFTSSGVAPTVTRDTVTVVRQGWALKAVGGAGEGFVSYNAIPSARWHNGWRAKTIHIGCWLYSSSTNSVRLFINGGGADGPQYSSYHAGGSSWEWVTLSHALPNDATSMTLGISIGNTKTGYAWGLTGGQFGTPPQDFVAPPVGRGFLHFPYVGTVAATGDYETNGLEFCKPALILGSKATCKTAPLTTGMTWNVGKLTTAPSTFAALYTSNPQIAASSRRGDASIYSPTHANWETRCFNGNVTPGSSLVANTFLGVTIVSPGGTAAADARIAVEVLQYQDPLAGWKTAGEF
jgi:hypothetical protein